MPRHIVQHRRGLASQWAEKNTIIPKEGELVIEIDAENALHKLKIGDGVHTYAELAYLMAGDEIVAQVLTQARPRVVTITLNVDQWIEVTSETDPNLGYYGQAITLEGITVHSRLDLQPNADMLAEFKRLGVTFVTENKGGAITVYSVGKMPLNSYTMQATIVETEKTFEGDKIVGIPVGAPKTIDDIPEINLGEGDNSLQFAGATESSGISSIAMGDEAKSVTDYSVAIGKDVVAGVKGYYYSAIDLGNKNIYLSETKEQLPVIIGETGFSTITRKLGDKFFPDVNSSIYVYNGVIFDQNRQESHVVEEYVGYFCSYAAESSQGQVLEFTYTEYCETESQAHFLSEICIYDTYADYRNRRSSVSLESIEEVSSIKPASDYYNESFETPAYNTFQRLHPAHPAMEFMLNDEDGETEVSLATVQVIQAGKAEAAAYDDNTEETETLTFVEATDHSVYYKANDGTRLIIWIEDRGEDGIYLYSQNYYTHFIKFKIPALPEIVTSEGDEFCIINGDHHSVFSGKITAVDHNKITYEGDLGFTEIQTSEERPFEKDHVIYTPTNPTIGSIDNLFVGAFAAGRYNVAAGEDAMVAGYGNIVAANHGVAFGKNNKVGNFGFVTGNTNDATGPCSYAEGKENTNKGYISHVEGCSNKIHKNTTDDNRYIHIEGYSNTNEAGSNNHIEGVVNKNTNGSYNHLEGYKNTHINGRADHIEGEGNTVNMPSGGVGHNHVEGKGNTVASRRTHVQGEGNEAKAKDDDGNYVETLDLSGYYNIGNGSYQTVAGKFNAPKSNYARLTGGGTSTSDRKNIEELDWNGNLKLAGKVEATSGNFSSGVNITGGSLQMNSKNITNAATVSVTTVSATNINSANINISGNSVFGTGHTVESKNTQVEGLENTVISSVGANHVEGYLNDVNARYSHIEGVANEVTGSVSRVHVEGWHNIVNGDNQHVAGIYNKANANAARITGGGSKSARKNIEELDWNGNVWFAGNVYVGGSSQDDAVMLVTKTEFNALVDRVAALEAQLNKN